MSRASKHTAQKLQTRERKSRLFPPNVGETYCFESATVEKYCSNGLEKCLHFISAKQQCIFDLF